MITIEAPYCNPYSQESYNDSVEAVDPRLLVCPVCRHCGSLAGHGAYIRTVKSPDGPFRIRIRRVRCTGCGHTHALFPSFLVPYSQICLPDQMEIIRLHAAGTGYAGLMGRNSDIDENNISSVLRRFRRAWEQRSASECLPLSDALHLVRRCFRRFGCQFMQIKKLPNELFPAPT